MAFIPFKKNPKCVVTDDLFLEITWEDGKSPEEDSELLGIIEGLDQQYLDTFEYGIEDSLPYVTFSQAELLFRALQEAYGSFQLKRVALCHLEGKEAVSEGEVFAVPFVIDADYQNLLLPLISAILSLPDFQSYSYQDKREYFINQIFPAYKTSLGLQESALPLFPEEGEVLTRASVSPTNRAAPLPKQETASTTSSTPQKVKAPSLKKVYLLIGICGTLALIGAVSSITTIAQLSKQSEQVAYLHQELKKTQAVTEKEHQIDTFSRYFLPYYYSGNKDSLKDFLSEGDAKYTVPKEGTLQSVILEKISYDDKTKDYQVTYVLSLKQNDSTSSLRLSFVVKVNKGSKYGFVVTTEPQESNYIK